VLATWHACAEMWCGGSINGVDGGGSVGAGEEWLKKASEKWEVHRPLCFHTVLCCVH